MLSEIQTSYPLTRRSVPPRLFSLPITCLPSLLQKSDNKAIYESYPKGVQTCHVRETLWFLTKQGLLTSLEEMSNSQCCLGWGLSGSWHLDICTQIYTQVELGVNLGVHHMKYALHSALCFFYPRHYIFLGITAHNYPFKAHNDSTGTRLPALKYWMSNSRCSRKYSLRIPSHGGLCL